MTYTPLPPETDTNLQNNPHYWLYKVTREALDNKDKNHPLADMGHIWNRWACEGLSEAESEALGIKINNYFVLNHIEKRKIKKEINKEIQYFNTEKIIWDFADLDVDINFRDVLHWQNETNFDKFIFIKNVNFSVLNFMKNISFVDTKFIQKANFEKAIFAEDADFSCAKFRQDANFEGTIFEGDTHFYNSTVIQKAKFNNAKFLGNSDFTDTTFTGIADFQETKFLSNADFKHSKFKENADFWNATFKQTVDFSKSEFTGNMIKFNECKFFKPTNDNTEFDFKNTIFATKVNFSESTFEHLPDLTGTDFRAGVNLDKVKFPSDLVETAKPSFPTAEAKPQGKGNLKNTDEKDSLSFSDTSTSSVTEKTGITRYDDCPIRGGLKTYKDAAITWHALQTEMEKAGYHEQAVTYFGHELEAKYLDENTDTSFKWVLWLYKHISSYGQSIAKPIGWWFGLIGLFGFTYCCFIGHNVSLFGVQEFWLAVKFSLKGAFPFISDQTTFFDRMFTDPALQKECLTTKEPIPFYNTLELLKFPLLYGLHSVLSLILIFLFGLGVRHRLRLK